MGTITPCKLEFMTAILNMTRIVFLEFMTAILNMTRIVFCYHRLYMWIC